MVKTLRTISINFPFKNPTVVYEPTFSTSRALFDFDIVVVRPYSFLERVSGGELRKGGRYQVEWPKLSSAKNEISAKTEDLNRLLSGGGLLVVILDVFEELVFRADNYFSNTKIHTTTNYDFLDPQFYLTVRNGTGDRVEYLNPADPFAKAIKGSSVQWTAFLDGPPSHRFNSMTIFARNGTGSYVGAAVEVEAGHVVFLPNFKDLNENEFFEACQEYRFVREGTPPPTWVSSVFLPGESAAEKRIVEVDQKISQFQLDRDLEIQKREMLRSYKKLLFEKGKYQLEPIVRRALDDLGFNVLPGGNIPGTQFEIDGRTEVGSSPGILEIKGSKNQIALDEFSPFVIKLLADFQKTKTHSKGIIVANGLCAENPDKRLGDRIFSSHVLEAAMRHSVALVNSVELYWVICGALMGELSDLSPIRETILTTNGYVDLRSFTKSGNNT